ncbi:MAG TPA: hypothetical protein DDZ42_11895 [Candidatus Rokubacteria bacterium]|nr:hypothetical protein [Candidatus Rokubacteria bacterium]
MAMGSRGRPWPEPAVAVDAAGPVVVAPVGGAGAAPGGSGAPGARDPPTAADCEGTGSAGSSSGVWTDAAPQGSAARARLSATRERMG